MPTAKKRLNLSLPRDIQQALEVIAKGEKIPVAQAAVKLIEASLEICEDMALIELAEERKKSNRTFYTHEEAWQNFTK